MVSTLFDLVSFVTRKFSVGNYHVSFCPPLNLFTILPILTKRRTNLISSENIPTLYFIIYTLKFNGIADKSTCEAGAAITLIKIVSFKKRHTSL